MKTIIALKGKVNSGKSSTIGLLKELLIKSKYLIIKQLSKNSRGKDFCVIFKIGEIKLGICSMGDIDETLKNWLISLIDSGCIIIVCACHTRGKTIKVLDQFKQKGYNIEYKEKSVSIVNTEQTVINNSDAKYLFDKIKDLIQNNHSI